jgi:hypothetical protein
MKTSWIMFAFIVDSNSVSHEIFVWSQGKFYLITPLACLGTNSLCIQAMGCDLDPHVLSHVFFMLHWLWVALWMVARVME